MPPETLIIFGAFCVGGLLFLLIGGGMVALFFWRLRGMGQVFGSAQEALQAETEEYFASVVPQLLHWQAGSLLDLSSHLEMTGISALGSVHYQGTLMSLSQPKEPGWLAYEMRLKRAKGPLLLRTSSRAWQLDIERGFADVVVDGTPLGRLRVRGRETTLLDVDGRPIGRYYRQRRGLVITAVVWQKGLFDPAYGPVEIHGRSIAEINNNLIRSVHLRRLDQPMPALVRNLTPELGPREEDWLVALIGLEVYYRVLARLGRSGY
jgi:hypothetical protein